MRPLRPVADTTGLRVERFVKIADEGTTCDFINLDQVTMVQCSVRRTGGVLDLSSFVEDGSPTPTPPEMLAVVTLRTANGTGELRFSEFEEAERWLDKSLGVSVSFSQL